MARRQVVVIGLGRFGSALATALYQAGHEVLAVDVDRRTVQEISHAVSHAVQADATDAEALAELGVERFDVGVVGVSSDMERSILATVQLKRAGVPYVIAKAQTALHGEILAKVGADRVVFPERETGLRLAHSFAASNTVDYLPVGQAYGISTLAPPPTVVGHTVGSLRLRERYDLSLLMIQRETRVLLPPGPDETIRADDLLVIAGRDDAMARLSTDARTS
jgi:trk system potassium uptake protein TrkA